MPLEGIAQPTLRVAVPDDRAAVDALMKLSVAALFPRYYSEEQAASAVVHVAQVDTMLLADGTYFALESGGELVACGGWSRRDKLYTGSGDGDADARLLDPASEPARVRAMFVRADWTRRGLGRRILEACEEAGRDAPGGAALPGVRLAAGGGARGDLPRRDRDPVRVDGEGRRGPLLGGWPGFPSRG